MEMKMHDCLSAIFTAVVDYAESLVESVDLSYLGYYLGDCIKIYGAVFRLGAVDDVIEVLLGKNEDMSRSNGIDVPDAKNLIVLIYLG